MERQPHDHELIELDREECLALLAAGRVGRFAVASMNDAPLVVPVNYVMDGDAVVFRTAAGEKLAQLRRRASFEVDGLDQPTETGWSVLVRGFAYEATSWEVAHLDLEPWAAGDKDRWVRIVPTAITGRRITAGRGVVDGRAYL